MKEIKKLVKAAADRVSNVISSMGRANYGPFNSRAKHSDDVQASICRVDEIKKSAHQKRIEQFMVGAGQAIPDSPRAPSGYERLLRIRLIMEELLETAVASGVAISTDSRQLTMDSLVFKVVRDPDMVEVADGLADLSVVVIGSMSTYGISDIPLLEEVDQNNINKLTGGYRDEYGKFRKPPNHIPPDILNVLRQQGWNE